MELERDRLNAQQRLESPEFSSGQFFFDTLCCISARHMSRRIASSTLIEDRAAAASEIIPECPSGVAQQPRALSVMKGFARSVCSKLSKKTDDFMTRSDCCIGAGSRYYSTKLVLQTNETQPAHCVLRINENQPAHGKVGSSTTSLTYKSMTIQPGDRSAHSCSRFRAFLYNPSSGRMLHLS